jgi:hypothetical protein
MIRFCFFGANPPALNAGSNQYENKFEQKILYSLVDKKSPDYIYINPYDGCVKLSQTFDIYEASSSRIEYSVKIN